MSTAHGWSAAVVAGGTSAHADPPHRVDLQALARLLQGYGLTARLHGSGPSAPWLVVSNGGRTGTVVFVGVHPVLRQSALYGFGDLYLGLADELPRVAARLAWLLGAVVVGDQTGQRAEVATTPENEKDGPR